MRFTLKAAFIAITLFGVFLGAYLAGYQAGQRKGIADIQDSFDVAEK